jgi:D-serine deaminase-like pyridoxal phosphate-dependent protein
MNGFGWKNDLIKKPTLLLDKKKAIRNIERMADKARLSEVRLRPHFKTHQSAEIGEWFRQHGVEAITVTSVDMASYFADAGWTDITVAFTVNMLQIDQLNELAKGITLSLLVESADIAQRLSHGLETAVNVWLKLDAGYHRTGIPWDDGDRLIRLARVVHDAPRLNLQGILTHAGHTYGAGSPAAISQVYEQVLRRMQTSQRQLRDAGLPAAISIGDTPGCSVAESFVGVDEIRPGNYVFYDLMQLQIGACAFDDIAVGVACPVVAKHRSRQQFVLYGGAVHLSKEYLLQAGGRPSYGGIALPAPDGWTSMDESAFVSSLSQEHGIVQADEELVNRVEVGDVLVVIPIHSCLTANLYSRYLLMDGTSINMATFQ